MIRIKMTHPFVIKLLWLKEEIQISFINSLELQRDNYNEAFSVIEMATNDGVDVDDGLSIEKRVENYQKHLKHILEQYYKIKNTPIPEGIVVDENALEEWKQWGEK